jgi:iron complex transport system substrate-binding protein
MRACRPTVLSDRGQDGFFLRAARVVTALAAVLLAACSEPERTSGARSARDSVSVVDDAGQVVALDAPAARVVSLVPSVTDVLLALELDDRLIARTEYDLDPRLDSLPSVGPGLTPNIEWLASRAPDLVIAWRDVEGRALVERLAELGIPVYASRLEDVTTALTTITRIGVLVGEEVRADSLRRAIQARLDSVRSANRSSARPTVLYLVGGDPPYAPGPGTFVHELIEIAGGANVLADLADGWHSVSTEEVVRRDPDLIVLPVHADESGVAAALSRRAGWRDLRAVRTGQVHEVDGELFGRPGPRLDRAAGALADLLGRTRARAHARGTAASEVTSPSPASER